MKTLILPLIAILAVGCGEGSATDPKVEAVRLDSAKQTRALFDKSGGNYDSLSTDDKTAALKLFGGKESDARRSWSEMKARSGGGIPTSGPSAEPPGGPPSAPPSGAPSAPTANGS